MATHILNTDSNIQCTHGAPATLMTANTVAKAKRSPALLETDVHLVSGCPFGVPCVLIKWTAGATQVTVKGIKVLTRSSVGQCYNAAGAVQGVAIIANTQTKAQAR